MSFKSSNNTTAARDSGGKGTALFGLRCFARVAAPKKGLSRVRLSVTEPRCCLPCLGKRRVLASFTFSEEDWAEARDGQYEICTAYSFVDLARFDKLQGDLPVKVKWWVGRRAGKTRLDESLGDVLQLLHSRSHLTLQVVSLSGQVSVCWAGLDDEVVSDSVDTSKTRWHTFINKSSGRTITLPGHEDEKSSWIFPGAWTSQDDELDEEDLSLLNTLNFPPSSATEIPQGAIGDLHAPLEDEAENAQWPTVTFINNSSGRIITLPAHEEVTSSWIFPGAWTSQDDELDQEDLMLLHALTNRREDVMHKLPSSPESSPPQRENTTPRGSCRGGVSNTLHTDTLKGPSREVLWIFAFLLLALWVVSKVEAVMFQL